MSSPIKSVTEKLGKLALKGPGKRRIVRWEGVPIQVRSRKSKKKKTSTSTSHSGEEGSKEAEVAEGTEDVAEGVEEVAEVEEVEEVGAEDQGGESTIGEPEGQAAEDDTEISEEPSWDWCEAVEHRKLPELALKDVVGNLERALIHHEIVSAWCVAEEKGEEPASDLYAMACELYSTNFLLDCLGLSPAHLTTRQASTDRVEDDQSFESTLKLSSKRFISCKNTWWTPQWRWIP